MSGDIVYENGRCTLYYIFRSEKRTLERKGRGQTRKTYDTFADAQRGEYK